MALDPKVDKLLNSRHFLPQTIFPQLSVDVKGVPVIVPISLSFRPNPNINPTHPWEIFGTIVAVHGEDIVYHIYNRKADVPDYPTLDIHGFLRLSPPISCPISSFFPELPLKVTLTDIKGNHTLFKDEPFSLDYTGYTNYNKVDYKMVEGDHGTLQLKYITYQTAVFARVKIVFKKKADLDASEVVDVAGSITASWYYDTSDISLHSDHDEDECLCISIMNPTTQVAMGKSMDLVRPLLAVPAYSLLVIHVDLNVSEYGEINKVMVIPVSDSDYFLETIQGPNGLLCHVDGRFFHEYDYFDVMEIDEGDGSETSNEGKEKKIKVDHDTEALSSYTVFSTNIPGEFKGEKLLEVFSVLVVAKNENDIYNIHGKIKVTDPHHKDFYIYDRDEGNAEKIEGKGTLCLEGPHDHSFVLSNCIDMQLKVGDSCFCLGFLNWTDVMAKKIWLDSHLCSVIKGQLGYATVHYMIYSSAVQATVKLYLISSNRCRRFGSVSGKIAAEHECLEYDTYFVKEYYRSIVFSRTRESPALLPEEEESIPVPPECVESGISSSDGGSKTPKLLKGTGIQLPLSKSVVCVWDDASLVFDLNLSAMIEMQGSEDEELAFSGRAEFEIGRKMCVAFQNGDYQVCVLVDWRRGCKAGN